MDTQSGKTSLQIMSNISEHYAESLSPQVIVCPVVRTSPLTIQYNQNVLVSGEKLSVSESCIERHTKVSFSVLGEKITLNIPITEGLRAGEMVEVLYVKSSNKYYVLGRAR